MISKNNKDSTKSELFFNPVIRIVGVNPFVFVPDKILKEIFIQAGKDRGPIPICGKLNGKKYTQTLIKYRGAWRLYINTTMLKDSPGRVGEKINLSLKFDPKDRSIKPHPDFLAALEKNPEAKQIFDNLSPSGKHEIVRYINNLKTEDSKERNIRRAINFLLGKERFVGRDKP